MPEKFTNMTLITEFLLMGFPDGWLLLKFYATRFLLIYLVALMGNLLIITFTTVNQHLQVPMYFFLKNLSLLDICYISVTVPKSIMNSLTNSHSISFQGCASQIFLVVFCAVTEFSMLIVMSYDCYLAICHPLHYEAIMNRCSCVQVVTASWFSGCAYSSIHVAGTFSVSFCGSNIVHQFFCDILSLLILTCYGENNLEYAFLIASCCFDFVYFILMIVSYVHIFSTVLRIPSAQDSFKSFSTCMPHITVVTLFLSSGFIVYLRSTSKSPSSLNIFVFVLYSLLPPTLNPVIYSLRNKDMKVAFVKMFGRIMDQRCKCLKHP